MRCEHCNGENMDFIDNKKQAAKLFLLGCFLFPLFFIFWTLAALSMFAKPVYKCKDCNKINKKTSAIA